MPDVASDCGAIVVVVVVKGVVFKEVEGYMPSAPCSSTSGAWSILTEGLASRGASLLSQASSLQMAEKDGLVGRLSDCLRQQGRRDKYFKPRNVPDTYYIL